VNRGIALRTGSALAAAALVALSSIFPLWSMTMRAPQYPKGLRLDAFGSGMVGDVRELNIINHYVGMPPIDPAPALETALFPTALAVVIALCLMSPLHRWARRLAIAAVVAMPIGILIDVQWWLYMYGHSLDPKAPIRLEPFTPLVMGSSKLGNFVTSSTVSWGVACLVAAAVVLVLGDRLSHRFEGGSRASGKVRAAAAVSAVTLLVTALAVSLPGVASAQPPALQARLDAAPRGSTVTVDGGIHRGRIIVRGPLTVVGASGAVIDGAGEGSVVTIEGEGVVFRGFTVRNSGRQVTEEAAGIKATGNGHRIEANDVHDVYFGIHIGDGGGHVVQGNRITPGEHHGARPGHGISAWHVHDSQLRGNRIADARDGIYLSFTDGVLVSGNEVTRCRYGLHSMYSERAEFSDNLVSGNLLGAALMNSDRLVLARNRIEQHRQGAAAYGVLLKDIGNLVASDNVIAANRVGVYAEGVPDRPGREARLTGNIIAGNEVGLALQGNAALTVAGNRIAENLTDVRALGRQLSSASRWSHDGRGNSWSLYRGYDADRNGVGDVPHTVEDAMDALVRRNPLVQAFLYTPAHLAIEAAARMFPLFRQQPVLVDEHPLMSFESRGSR
jgi:nitrous oxidase accessory protein